MKPIRDVLEMYGELEWARGAGSEEPLRPPFIAWRYGNSNEKLEARLEAAVNSYRGRVAWTMRKGDRNWVIEPTAFHAYGTKFRVDVEAIIRFGEEFPGETRSALEDVFGLAEHLKRELARG